MFTKRINIFTGHFGSGKTEIAVNYALKLAQRGDKTAIVDFDIVNPFFRTTDAKEYLEEQGIWVITPMYANTNVDVPALPAEINTLFQKKEYSVVFDVGGDDLGARALSRYRKEILSGEYEMFCVINTRRPMTDTAEKIEEMIWSIEQSSRLKISSLVNNTNLLGETTGAGLLEGEHIIRKVSEKLGIPISFTAVMENESGEIAEKAGVPVLTLRKLIRLPWD